MAAVTEPSAALPGHLSRCPLLPHRVSIRSPRCVLREMRRSDPALTSRRVTPAPAGITRPGEASSHAGKGSSRRVRAGVRRPTSPVAAVAAKPSPPRPKIESRARSPSGTVTRRCLRCTDPTAPRRRPDTPHTGLTARTRTDPLRYRTDPEQIPNRSHAESRTERPGEQCPASHRQRPMTRARP